MLSGKLQRVCVWKEREKESVSDTQILHKTGEQSVERNAVLRVSMYFILQNKK